MPAGHTRSRKRWYVGALLAVLVIASVAGYARLKGASADIDQSKVVAAEPGTMVRSVVATGKIEPMTKVEIKSKANGIIEALPVTEAIRRLVIKRASAAVIKTQAVTEGMKTLRMAGIDKALEGATTLEEVWRVTAEDR